MGGDLQHSGIKFFVRKHFLNHYQFSVEKYIIYLEAPLKLISRKLEH